MLRLIDVVRMPPYLLPVGVGVAPVPQLLLAPDVPVLLLLHAHVVLVLLLLHAPAVPVVVVLLRFQALFHHRYHFHRYQPGGLLLHHLLLLPRHPLVVVPLQLELSPRWL